MCGRPHGLPILALLAAAAAWSGTGLAFEPHVFVVTSDGSTGNCAAMTIETPWTVATNLEPIGGDPLLRHFFGRHYVVNRDTGTIQVIDPATFDTVATLEPGLAPQDIVVIGTHKAYVSRMESADLLELDPTTGATIATIDLSSLADADGIPDMGTMHLDGHRLFVQIQRLDHGAPSGQAATPPSCLAVIDVRTNQLLDADPGRPGVQALDLAGHRPAYKMQAEPANRRLFVSVPAGFFDGIDGAVEEIDLDELRSLRFVTTETTLQTLDLGAFTLVSPSKGFVVTHTEIVESSHVTGFSRLDGTPVSQIYTTLLGSIRSIAHDPPTDQVFVPDHTPDGTQGVLVFHASTDEVLTPTPIDVGGPPRDLVVARPVSPGEARNLLVTDYDPFTGLSLEYEPACQAADHNIVFGPLSQVDTHGYSGQICGVGNLGGYDAFAPGEGSFFFLLVGSDGRTTEGSYGVDGDGTERPEDTNDPVCTFTRELTRRCDGPIDATTTRSTRGL